MPNKKSSSKPKADNDSNKENIGGKAQKSTGQFVNVRHILCQKYDKKEKALAELIAGKSFDKVASNFSEDKARNGGSLGWKRKTDLLPNFAEAAFNTEPSTLNAPKWREVMTDEGYHIIMVEGYR